MIELGYRTERTLWYGILCEPREKMDFTTVNHLLFKTTRTREIISIFQGLNVKNI